MYLESGGGSWQLQKKKEGRKGREDGKIYANEVGELKD